MTEPNTQAETRLPVTVPPVGDAHGEATVRPDVVTDGDDVTAPASPSAKPLMQPVEPAPVRVAVPEDEAGIMDLCRAMHAETGIFRLNEAKVLRMIRRAWNQDHVIIGVIGPIGAPVGVAALLLTDSWYSDDPVFGDLMVFVHPNNRRSSHARGLLRFAKKAAKSLEVPMTIGVLGAKHDEERTWKARLRYYRKEFGEPVGFYFLYNRKEAA